MNYRVIYSPSVRDDLREHIQYLIDQRVSAEIVERWYSRLFDAVDSLCEMPRRNAADRVASKRYGFEVRKLSFGRYLIHYRIDDDRRLVEVLSFVHAARRKEVD
jgi:plasmid stabilization system protein ParE